MASLPPVPIWGGHLRFQTFPSQTRAGMGLSGERVLTVSHTTGNQASRPHKETNGDIQFLSRKIRPLASEKVLLSAFPKEVINLSKDKSVLF